MRDIVCVRGGGDLATGVVQKLWHAGFSVYITEIDDPTAIRRTVALSGAMTADSVTVEDMTAVRARSVTEVLELWEQGAIPVLCDPAAESAALLKPGALIDAIIAKRNLGTRRDMAPITIALGPGFSAPEDVDAIIETARGHTMGRMILSGSALADTGTPGNIAGCSSERVLHAPCSGKVDVLCDIGAVVAKGQTVCAVGAETVAAPIDGLVRGMIRPGMLVRPGLKIGDIDPRTDVDWKTISDKSRAIGGAVLEALIYLKRLKKIKIILD
jgi:xanthine dehydrogenase accessory factor